MAGIIFKLEASSSQVRQLNCVNVTENGIVCMSGFWRLEDKIGMPLEEIHFSGMVPQFK